MLEALDEAQLRLKGSSPNWCNSFFAGNRHRNEEGCSEELVKLLLAISTGVELRVESRLADHKRVDIECSVGPSIMLPIEVKGQWHDQLWTAADSQLDTLYSNDWRAERRGIYLVLWFGPPTKLKRPPAGIVCPTTPADLQRALTASSKAARDGRVVIRVLDLTRPDPV